MAAKEVRSAPPAWLPRVTFHRGEVVIAGAGPGSRGHVTLQAMAYLLKAEVIVYDRLTDHSIFEFAAKGTELIYAGKGPRRSLQQEKINAILLAKAKQGRRVLRWKGGDPYVFGRGFDELRHLTDGGIRVTVLPGISSVIGLPTLAGIPVLHRGTSRTLTIFTGELGRNSRTRDIRLDKIARVSETLVGVMVVKNLDRILKEILKARKPGEPAALIVSGGRPGEKIIVSTLGELAREARRRGATSPALLVVGGVVGLR